MISRVISSAKIRYRYRYSAWYGYRERGRAHARLLWPNPAIVYMVHGRDPEVLLRGLADRPVHLLWTFPGGAHSPQFVESVAAESRSIESNYPRAVNHYLANTPSERDWASAAGLRTALASQNGLIDERIFDIGPTVSQEWDAIYDAQIHKAKRHALASQVESLALISYIYRPSLAFDPGYAAITREAMSHAVWLNDPYRRGYRKLSPPEVAAAYNRAGCGLMLSAEEGAVYASTQYLLSGIPVVSTPSEGGRELFYSPENSVIVEPSPDAVKAGVSQAQSLRKNRALIRSITLERVLEHRKSFVDYVSEILRQESGAENFEKLFPTLFSHTMLKFQRLDSLVEEARRS